MNGNQKYTDPGSTPTARGRCRKSHPVSTAERKYADKTAACIASRFSVSCSLLLLLPQRTRPPSIVVQVPVMYVVTMPGIFNCTMAPLCIPIASATVASKSSRLGEWLMCR